MTVQIKEQTFEHYLNFEECFQFEVIDDSFFKLNALIKECPTKNEITTEELLSHPIVKKIAVACDQLTGFVYLEKKLLFSKIIALHTGLSYYDIEKFYKKLTEKKITSDEYLLHELRTYYQQQVCRLCGAYKSSGGKVSINKEVFVNFIKSVMILKVMKLENREEELYMYNKQTGLYVCDVYVIGRIIRWLTKAIDSFKWTMQFEKDVMALLMRDCSVIQESDFNKTHINLLNGSLNLMTLEVDGFSPNYLCTQSLGLLYDPKATCKRFEKFVSEVMEEDQELIQLLQEIAGYIISNETKANKAFFLYGAGGSGKSVMSDVFQALVSKPLVSNVSLKNLETRFGMEPLIQKKLNIASENEADFVLSNENFKAITSGDTVNIDLKGRPAVNLRLKTKLIFVTNNLPTFSDASHALIRRLIIVPFNRQFGVEEQNKNLTEELLEELPGIFNWALSGLKRLVDKGYVFTHSKKSEEVLHSYQENINPVELFCKECIIQNSQTQISRKELLSAYEQWIEDNAVADQGTKSPQKFWKFFKETQIKLNWNISEKRIRGMNHIVGLEVVR